jgi:Peptidase A4 family
VEQRWAAAVVTLSLVGGLLASPAAMASGDSPSAQPVVGSAHPVSHAPKRKFGRSTSTNWSGYAVPGTGATHVIGTWTARSVTCAAGENSWSSPWVGIDGDTSNTVEQIGTDSDCQNGSPVYYAWYEMYPKSLVTVGLAVHPGDSFTGEVTRAASGAFVLKLTNNTTNASFQTTQRSKRARRASVEWVMEGPSNGLLSNFGSQPFSAASATISNATGNLGSFINAERITMVTNQGVPRAVPSAITGGTSFSVSWQHG